ncbi:MAG: hypothetical protein HY677_04510 [Chloroflexi bacterium]|nr:hypothetical protein [Chloroflexota bacterium]
MRAGNGAAAIRRFINWQTLFLLGLAIWCGLLAYRLSNYWIDDMAITYRYAKNIATGVGFVYQPGERVLGTTTPLYTLILAGFYFIAHNLPAVSVAVSAAALFGVGCLVYVLCGRRLPGMLAAAFVVSNGLLVETLGLETAFYSLLMLLSFWLFERGRERASGIVVGLTTLTRPDGLLLAAALGLGWLVRRRRLPWGYVLACVAIVLPWVLFAWPYFGGPLPGTLGAKGGLRSPLVFFQDAATSLGPTNWRSPFFVVLAFPALLSLRQPRNILLFAWGASLVVAYSLLGPWASFWYFAPAFVAYGVLMGRGLAILEKRISSLAAPGRVARAGAFAAVAVGLLIPLAVSSVRYSWAVRTPPHNVTYEGIGVWMTNNIPKGDLVLIEDVGIPGYISGSRLLDTFALVSPQMQKHLGDLDYAIARFLPEYTLIKRGTWQQQVNSTDWFHVTYAEAARFGTPGDSLAPEVFYRLTLPPPVAAGQVRLTFGERLQLNGWSLRLNERVLAVRLLWKGLSDRRRATVFVHLRDASDKLIAQKDAEPLMGSYPLPAWQPGEDVEDTFFVVLPPGAPRELRVVIGIYDTSTQERLPVQEGAKEAGKDREIELAKIDLAALTAVATR